MIRVGFVVALKDHSWVGGVNYLANLVHAVQSLGVRRIEPVILTPPDTPGELLAGLPAAEMVRAQIVDEASRLGFFRKITGRALGHDILMERFLRAHDIAVLSHSGHLGARGRIPTIGWIADFQHKRMPEFFSSRDLGKRDRAYRRMCDFCSVIVVSSLDAQKDLGNFDPNSLHKSRVLHFVSGLGSAVHSCVDAATLCKRYKFQGPYFYLPNQFWAHKNHRIVIDALALLKSRGKHALVFATGHTNDVRQPRYFDEIMNYVEARGVGDRFRVFGLVPYEQVTAFMRNAVAIINPSRFEGWSTTVEESKSLGKKIVLSNIPVHREQAPARGVFFDPSSAEDLAEIMARALIDYSPDEEVVQLCVAQKDLARRFGEFGKCYEKIVIETLRIAR
jgi:glycosyltransferase involved in cell wall biosynthesis